MWSSGVIIAVLVAISAVSSKPVDLYGKDDGSLLDSLHKHLDEFQIPEDLIIGGSLAKSQAEAASIAGKGHHYGSLSAAAAKASAIAVSKGDHKYGGASVAKADAASKAVSTDHYGKGSAAKSAAAAEAAAIGLKKKDHYYKPDHHDDKHYFKDQPQGDDHYAHYSGSKAAAAAESVAKSVGDKYHKGASLAKSLSKAESFSGKGISASSALAKSVSISA